MASLTKKDGRHVIQFMDGGKRRTISIRGLTDATAMIIMSHVEHLHAAKAANISAPAETVTWIAGVGFEMRTKLEDADLIQPRPAAIVSDLAPMIDRYIAGRTDLKSRSRQNLIHARETLVAFFGAGRDYRTINKAEAEDYARDLRTRLASTTVSTHIKKARQVFRDAEDRKLIAENPFVGIKPGSQVNDSRNQYVPASDVLKAIDACPTPEWRLIFALARFGGLRIPSELHGLKWADIDFGRGRMVVHSPKTKHHQGKDKRTIPIFPQLLPFLKDARSLAPADAVNIITKNLSDNIRQEAMRIIAKTDLVQWPRIFQNLRASCETDLAASHPLHVACAWIGNSQLVAKKHYLTVTDADFDAAAKRAAKPLHGYGQNTGGRVIETAFSGSYDVVDDGELLLSGCDSFAGVRRNLDWSSAALQNQIKRLKQAAEVMRKRDIRFVRFAVTLSGSDPASHLADPGSGILLSNGGAR